MKVEVMSTDVATSPAHVFYIVPEVAEAVLLAVTAIRLVGQITR